MNRADLELIIDAAHEAGELAADLRRKGLEIAYKPDDNTPVTNADLAADALLKARLRAARPDYGWLSEETADDPERLGRRHLFVVDPIDGTRAFLNDRPWWAVSIAVVDGHRPSAGVVFAPELQHTYAAAAGDPPTLNGQVIAPSVVSVLEDCAFVGDPKMLAHPSWPAPWPDMRVAQRNSTALRICLVAAGAADATLALAEKYDWDLAAADLIAGQAGCVVGDHLGRGFSYNGERPLQRSLLCATPALAPLIRERVRHIAL
jgi:myo-inositol-1(or 4)-monophosphatase